MTSITKHSTDPETNVTATQLPGPSRAGPPSDQPVRRRAAATSSDKLNDGASPVVESGSQPVETTVPLAERLALSVEEAGALLGLSRDLAYDLVARNELPAVRLGRRLVVPRRALEETLLRAVDGHG